VYLAFLTLVLLSLLSLILSYVESIAYFDGIYFAVVTFSTVGLGDVVPKTTIGKLKYWPQNTFSNSSK
jgi:voltage-gated potassium channel Kch